MKFNFDKIMKKDVYIHCDTEEKAKLLLEAAENRKLCWNSGEFYSWKNKWEEEGENMCYCLYDGFYDSIKKVKERKETIYSFEDVILQKEESTKSSKKISSTILQILDTSNQQKSKLR